MSLEEDVRRELDMAIKSLPVALRASTEGPQQVEDPVGDLVMPMLTALQEAILRVARAVDAQAK